MFTAMQKSRYAISFPVLSLCFLTFILSIGMNQAIAQPVWVPVGTSTLDGHVSGRATCIAFSRDTNPAIYLGTASGGLWKSIDNGQNWVSLSDSWKTLAVGGVAVDPNNPNTIYAGTGEANGASSGYSIGIYKSTDGGLNWQLLTGSGSSVTCQMMVNPANSNFVYQATEAGVFLSKDAGRSWSNVCSLGGLTSLVMNPLNPAVFYAAGGSQISKSVDSGKTWKSLKGFPVGNLMVIAMTAADTNYIYLSSGVGGGSTLARSTNGGASWKTMQSDVPFLGYQGWYANAIAVNPKDANDIVVGGQNIYRATDGGKTLLQKTDGTHNSSSSDYTQATIHGLVYNGSTLYALTDGGIFHSESNGESWEQDMNKNLSTLLLVGGDAAPDFSYFAAGAENNGTLTLANGATIWTQAVGEGGGKTFISQTDGQIIYGASTNGMLHRSTDRGITWTNNILPNSLSQGSFECDVSETNPNVVATCGPTNVYLTTDGGNDNFPAITKNNLISGGPVCVAISKSNPNYLYVAGTSAVYSTTDQGKSWTKSTTSLGGTPTSITTDPNDPTHVYLTISGGSSKHFFISTDAGVTWTAPATNLPNLNYQEITVDRSGHIYISNDYGVLGSFDGGVTWHQVGDGLPPALVTSLHVRSHYLVAATYGRGMWYLDLSQLSDVNPRTASNVSNGSVSINAIYPNPVTTGHAQSTIQFSLKEDTHAILSVYDMLGREERILMNEWTTQGERERTLDLANLPAGQHYIILRVDGTSVTQPLTIE